MYVIHTSVGSLGSDQSLIPSLTLTLAQPDALDLVLRSSPVHYTPSNHCRQLQHEASLMHQIWSGAKFLSDITGRQDRAKQILYELNMSQTESQLLLVTNPN